MSSFFTILNVGIIVLTWFACSTATLTVDEQLQQMRENYMEIKEVLTQKVTTLEAKVMRLEAKVEEQESLLLYLQTERPTFEKTVPKTAELTNLSIGKSFMQRTCREVRAADPTLTSGMYWIDPDGQGVGDDPIYVYCDMTKGSTSILHDSESQIDVGHCADPGCYSRAINYSATHRQISALAQISSECHQTIKYDCVGAPLEVNGLSYSWWNDKNGNPQYFWAGSNASVHTCQCGIDHNCIESIMTCNCDSILQLQLADDGVITDKNILPVTRLNFGRTILESSSGVHTLGRFECSGQVAVSGMPTSCTDLWRIGHTLSGLYSIMGVKQIESVYCDFTKLPNDLGFQKWIGYADVKSSPVYFYVQRQSSFNATDVPIPFEIEKFNIGGAMNLQSGIFTCPRNGKYYFSFSGLANIPMLSSSSKYNLLVRLSHNGDFIGTAYADAIPVTSTYQWETFSLQSTLSLQAGDKIWVEMVIYAPGIYLLDNAYHYTHFNGFLLEEDISYSLNL